MQPAPQINLPRLRDIGWALWDPIGLLGPSGAPMGRWDDAENLPFAGEYDRHLIAAATHLRRGVPPERIEADLVRAEAHLMGLGVGPTTRRRAKAVVAAILADGALWSWPDRNDQR